jgi:ribonuclease P protein component
MAAESPARLRLTRAMRLRRQSDFESIRQQGRRLTWGCLILNFRTLPSGSGVRLGVVTSRRVGGAVIRSKARRWLREVFRTHQHSLAKPVDMVLIARPSLASKDYQGVEMDFLAALRHVRLLDFPENAPKEINAT